MQAIVILPPKLTGMMDKQGKSSGAAEIFGAKGPVFSTAIVAGVMAAKKTSDLIPFCHPVALEDCKIVISIKNLEAGAQVAVDETELTIDCTVKTTHKTGVEMEAMVGVTNAALCIYDMLKAVSHDIQIREIKLMSKSGGKSTFSREATN